MIADGEVREPKRIAFVSSNLGWGGSEALWSETAARLAENGHHVTAYKNYFPTDSGNIGDLKRSSCKLTRLAWLPLVPFGAFARLHAMSPPVSLAYQAARFGTCLGFRRRPDLVVLSQGGNHDGWYLASVCRRLRLPYVIVSHKATDLHWPIDRWLPSIQGAYRDAKHVFFVSEHNRKLTEEQLGFRLGNSSIVRNPFLVDWNEHPSWPSERNGLKLACVGRFNAREKGHDLLLRVLAHGKWRNRDVSVTFFGEGEQRQSIEHMAKLHVLSNVTFAGFEPNVARIWADHHGLILPSRAEGLPLTIVEAMLSSRVPIVTAVGGNAEVVVDGKTGFLAEAPTEASVDEALERAWSRRAEWRNIGVRAAEAIRELVPPDPASHFAERLLALVHQRFPQTESTLPAGAGWMEPASISPQAAGLEAA